MACVGSSLTIRDCTFLGNQANIGGGIYCWQCFSPTLVNCTFMGNQADLYGGGMYLNYSPATLTDCLFSGNEAAAGTGGGIHCYHCSPSVTGCTFLGNQTEDYGGGMYLNYYSSPTLQQCTFSGNAAQHGGGIFCWSNCTPVLTDCILAFSTQGAAVDRHTDSDLPTLVCCDVYGNADGDWTGFIADQYGVDGNFSLDPLFCDAEGGDVALCDDSPCLPSNHPPGAETCGLIGAWDAGCGPCSPVAVEGASWGVIKATYRW
jgi:predicted outer membrane repeat protein